jgi:hypothetical protein
MSIRLRIVNGTLVALCAARSVEKEGDIYLDDGAHHALANKFARDFNEEGWTERGQPVPHDEEHVPPVEAEESNNPNREWWDRTYT